MRVCVHGHRHRDTVRAPAEGTQSLDPCAQARKQIPYGIVRTSLLLGLLTLCLSQHGATDVRGHAASADLGRAKSSF
eukprot:671510-Amphidinium_carterae.1